MRGLVLRWPKEVPWHKILDGQIRSQDLRSKLARPNLRLVRPRKGGLRLGVTDLREKLSGSSSQPPPVSRAQGGVELQWQLTSFVRNTSSGAQAASHHVPLPHLKQTAPVIRMPAGGVHYGTGQGSKQTVVGLLQSLGLAKYSLIFQAEEVSPLFVWFTVLQWSRHWIGLDLFLLQFSFSWG
jgi:hypothetical protein